MTEFAYSGLGLNPHFGTPRNPWQRDIGRVPGGSSSGAAISVTDKMAYAGLGSDTGGSCRIPAAFTGLAGWKPTAKRIPLEGVLPLSFSLDSVGVLAASIDDCAVIDGVVSGVETIKPLDDISAAGLRLAVPRTLVLDNIDDVVGNEFDHALKRLSNAGISVESVLLTDFSEIPSLNGKGGFAAAESYAWHRTLLQTRGDLYDPRVKVRILRGSEQNAADYIDLLHGRANVRARIEKQTKDFDALIFPTVPIVAPRLSELESDADYARLNALTLRNPSVANFLDLCSASVPIHKPGAAPVGLMLVAAHGADHALLRTAKLIEKLLSTA